MSIKTQQDEFASSASDILNEIKPSLINCGEERLFADTQESISFLSVIDFDCDFISKQESLIIAKEMVDSLIRKYESAIDECESTHDKYNLARFLDILQESQYIDSILERLFSEC